MSEEKLKVEDLSKLYNATSQESPETMPPQMLPHQQLPSEPHLTPPGVVSIEEKNSMASLIEAMNDIEANNLQNKTNKINADMQQPLSLKSSDTKEMFDILSKFNEATSGVAEVLAEEAKYSAPAKEIIYTQYADDYIEHHGEWRINIKESNNKKVKKFDLLSPGGEIIAEDLLCYEAAYCLAKLMTKGKKINSPEFIEILNLEDEFASKRYEAMLYKGKTKKANHNSEGRRHIIYETKFMKAKDDALAIKRRLKTKMDKM